MHGGEVFVPRIPSMKIMDLAEAIAPECKIEFIGIRPGEKLHEVMISRDEARHSLRVDGKYVILPEHPWWTTDRWHEGTALDEGFEYTSDRNDLWITVDELKRMLGRRHERITWPLTAGRPVRRTLLPYGRQSIDEADIAAVVEVLRSDWLTTGPKVAEFERAVGRRRGRARVAWPSATGPPPCTRPCTLWASARATR